MSEYNDPNRPTEEEIEKIARDHSLKKEDINKEALHKKGLSLQKARKISEEVE